MVASSRDIDTKILARMCEGFSQKCESVSQEGAMWPITRSSIGTGAPFLLTHPLNLSNYRICHR